MSLANYPSRLAALMLLLCGSLTAFAQADLSLRLTQGTAQPTRYTSYKVTASVTNSGPSPTYDVAVAVPLPEGVVFTGGSENKSSQGTYSPYGDRVWEVGTLAANKTATLTITVYLLAQSAPVYYAQVLRSSAPDPDSRPGNGTSPRVNEDDEASTAVATAAAACDLKLTLGSVSCINDNRTPNDPSDDYFVAKVQASSPLRGDGRPVMISLGGAAIGLTSLTGTFTEVAVPARFIKGGTFRVSATLDSQLDCNVTVSGSVPNSCPGATAGCGFDRTFAGIAFPSMKLASQVGTDYVIESAGKRLTIASDGSVAIADKGGMANANVTFDSQPLPDGNRYRVQFVGGATQTITVAVVAPNGSVLNTYKVPVATALAGLGDVTISDLTTYAGQYVVTGTVAAPGASGRSLFVARGSLVKGDFAFTQFTSLVPGTSKAYASIEVAAVGQSGDVYLAARTATGYDLARVDASGRLVWGRTVVAGLNVGNAAYDTEVSTDGSRLYVASKEGSRLYLRALNTANGSEANAAFDISANALNATAQPATTNIAGILPLVGGKVLVAYSGTPAGSTVMQSELLWVAPDGTLASRLNVSRTVGSGKAAPTPVLETRGGDLVFTSATSAGLRVLQLRGDGSAAPDCGRVQSDGTIDLELKVESSSPNPRRYTVNAVTYTLTNRSAAVATEVAVDVPTVTGAVLAGGSEFKASQGTYSSYGSQLWTVGTLASGASATLTLNYFGLSASGYSSYGEVASAEERDVDSSPGNGTVGRVREDDEALVVVGGGLQATDINTQYLRMYPNPAVTGQSITFALEIPVETQQTAEIIVSDLAGRVVARRKVALNASTSKISLDLAGIPSGVYVAAVPALELEPQKLIISE